MAYSIEQIKGEISRGGGVAKGNLFRVILPVIPEIYLNIATGVDVTYPQSLNVLCKNVNMPGRQLLTIDRTIGVVNQKVVYGFSNEEVNMTFLGLNDYIVRKYFEDWQLYAMNQENHDVRYKTQYAKNVVIQQLDMKHRVTYSVTLEKAFPTQLLNVDFSNDNGQPVDINVSLSYTRWRRNNVIRDGLSTVIQDILEDITLRN